MSEQKALLMLIDAVDKWATLKQRLDALESAGQEPDDNLKDRLRLAEIKIKEAGDKYMLERQEQP